MFFETTFDIVKLVYLLTDFFFLSLENLLKIVPIFLFFLFYQLLQFPKLLTDHLFMDIIGLLNSTFISLTNG